MLSISYHSTYLKLLDEMEQLQELELVDLYAWQTNHSGPVLC